MRCGEMRERIILYRIITPNGPHQIFNPTLADVEQFATVSAKREDKTQSERWGMVTLNTVNRKQFIIRHRRNLPDNMAIGYNGQIYSVLGVQDLDNKKQWTLLLVGRLGRNVDALNSP